MGFYADGHQVIGSSTGARVRQHDLLGIRCRVELEYEVDGEHRVGNQPRAAPQWVWQW